uniref:Nonstructural protein 1 n=1 Tax=Phylloscopus fuscatus parvoviridae sp. TaxID=2794534 RepID=A0A8A4XC11_9VIRU|nr:MAG: nonstructural protein 1 [Phylloscopus fuscatus parvoviridae sp.]
MSVLPWITKQVKDGKRKRNDSEGSDSRTEAQEDGEKYGLSNSEEKFIRRYPEVCKAFESGLYEFFRTIRVWPDDISWRVEGVPSRDGYIVSRLLARRTIRLAAAANRNSILHSGVYRYSNFEEAKNTIDTVKKNGVCRIVLVSVHGPDHVHVLHDCTFSNRSCKCFNGFIPKRRSTDVHIIGKLCEERLAKVIFYYFNNQKWIYYCKSGEAKFSGELLGSTEVDRHARSRREAIAAEGILESSDSENGLLHDEDESDSDAGFSAARSSKGHSVGGSSKRKKEDFSEIIYNKLRRFGCSPLKDFSRTSDWFSDSLLRTIKPTHEKVLVAYNRLSYEVHARSLLEFHRYYEVKRVDDPSDHKFLFGSLQRDKFYERYFTKSISLVWIKKLLIWQYARDCIDLDGNVLNTDWKSNVYEQVRWLMNLLDRKTGKKNTWYIVSPPNAGKTFFCDCIADYFQSVGHLKPWNRNNSFPLEELDGARVCFWNEPNFESGNTAECLKLLGGDNLSVAIKYNRPSTVQNVPVICTSNTIQFPTTPEFMERIKYSMWQPCDILKSVGKKRLHPYALDLLFTDCENYFEEKIR